MPKKLLVSEQARRAVLDSDLSRYEIAKRAGLRESVLTRFVHGGHVTTATLDALQPVLGLTLTAKRKGA